MDKEQRLAVSVPRTVGVKKRLSRETAFAADKT